MRILTILGTRPEIIRLSRIIPRLDGCCEHVLAHTGQNYDERLSAVFFEELGLRQPCHYMGVESGSFGVQSGQILARSEQLMREVKPDRVLILGDTNSALSAIVAKRLQIPVFHMEAGNRCYDDRVPEEVNRRIVDHCSDILMPYTERSRMNLLREGISGRRVFVTGNPIGEVISHYQGRIDESRVLKALEMKSGGYFLVTLHRAENVDPPGRLLQILGNLERLSVEFSMPVLLSVHPRLRARMAELDYVASPGIRLCEPFGLFDFVHLESNAYCVLSDSGTVQEECTILRVPSVTLRDVTERPETQECGANILAASDYDSLYRAVGLVTESDGVWAVPEEYSRANVSETVVKLVTGHHFGLSEAHGVD